jgi:hypothetical protein
LYNFYDLVVSKKPIDLICQSAFLFPKDTGDDSGKSNLLFLSSFRSLKRIKLLDGFLDISFNVRCRWTDADYPLDGRFRIDLAVFSTGQLNDFIATFAGFDDDVAIPSGISAALFGHECAFRTLFDRLANHDNPSFLVP